MTLRTTLLVSLLSFGFALGGVCTARADVIPECKEGQRLQTYPLVPGEEMGHGVECVDDPSASSGCSAGNGAHGVAGWGALLVIIAVLASRRRRAC